MDGVTGTLQERMKNGYRTEKWTMMFYMNLFSAVILTGSIIAFHDLFRFINFIQAYPDVIQKICYLSAAGACGQIFIFKTVSDLGPLPLSIITTSRKLISVVISVILFQNPFSRNQLLGTVIVFAALFADVWEGSRSSSSGSVPSPAIEEEASDVGSEYDNVPDAPPVTRRKVRRE